MKHKLFMMLFLVAVVSSLTAYGQMIKRTDVIWARNASGPITLDGKLNEADWASAEAIHVVMGRNNGWPGSGWWWQSGVKPGTDPTDATVKFLVRGDSLYVGWLVKDKSIGAVADWAHFDMLLTNMRYPSPTGISGTPGRDGNTQQNYEITYGFYCGADWGDTLAGKVGGSPGFMGFAGSQNVWPRPDSLKTIWNAVTTVQGTSNDDATADTSWTTEFVINLKYFGYKPQQASGDIAMYSFSIWDYDYAWPKDTLKESSTTVWEQAVWANASPYSHLRVYMRPDVTTSSGAVPSVGPDWTIPVTSSPSPVLDGKLTEGIWKNAPSIQVQYGNGTIRSAYPSTMKWRSGQVQNTVNGSTNPVVDPSLATVKYFVKSDTLFLGFDVKDKFVQAVYNPDGSADGNRYDGFDIIFNDRGLLDGDSIFARHDFAFRVDTGAIPFKRMNDLAVGGWDSVNCVRLNLSLNSGTTVDTVGSKADSGYQAEMAIDLTKLGYPHGLGDGVAWFSIIFWDGDSFNGGSYGTKTWMGRPGGWDDGPAWFYVDQSASITGVAGVQTAVPENFALLGSYPNPFNPSTNIKFQVPQQSEITLDVYDVIGRLVTSKTLGVRQAGEHTVSFDGSALASGTYIYRLRMASTGATLVGKMMLLK